MAIVDIVTGPQNATLRQSSKDVKNPSDILDLIEALKETLSSTENGIGLAAPQVGMNVRLFVIHPDFVEEAKDHLVYINPVISRASRKKIEEEEGCLSLPDTWGVVARSQKVTVKALDENGKKFKVTGKGLLARLFQHEVDHLKGTLFIDHLHE